MDINKEYKVNDFWDFLFFAIKEINEIEKLCFALPGVVDPYRLYCIDCPNLDYWKNIDFSSLYEEGRRRGVRIRKILVSNDCNAGAVGVYKILRLQNKNIVYIAIGTGIGGGAILNNKLLIGANFSAMEPGHTKIYKKSYICGCGNWGCIETFASAKALTIYYNSKNNTNYSNLLSIIKNEPQHKVKKLFSRFSDYLSILLNNIIYFFDPDLIFLAGKIVFSSNLFEKQLIRKVIKKINLIKNFDRKRIVLLDDDLSNNTGLNIYNLVGSVFADEFL